MNSSEVIVQLAYYFYQTGKNVKMSVHTHCSTHSNAGLNCACASTHSTESFYRATARNTEAKENRVGYNAI